MKRNENLMEAMCRELETLDKKFASGGGEMSVQDLEKADKLYHALKSAETYYAMKESEEWEDKDASGRSYARRGRDSMGRFTSREGGSSREPGSSYGYSGYPGGSGYSGGYGSGGYGSGHFPMEWMPPMRY